MKAVEPQALERLGSRVAVVLVLLAVVHGRYRRSREYNDRINNNEVGNELYEALLALETYFPEPPPQ